MDTNAKFSNVAVNVLFYVTQMNWDSGVQHNMAISLHGTFGEFVPATYDGLSKHLTEMLGTETLSRSTLFDAGSGRGRMAIELASRLPLRASVGVELDENLHMFAQQNSTKALQVYPMSGPCVFARGDLQCLGSLQGANICVSFDRAFGDTLRGHLCHLANASKDIMVFVSCFANLHTKHGWFYMCCTIVYTNVT